eukprot:8064119-Alexandrium_andersonii.AAC.1
MSASLVGSEMCIRDRRMRTPRATLPTGPARSGATRWFGSMWPRSPGPLPVSYTHLTLPTICSV